MKGRIKVIDGIYPVTVDEAIYISGTNKTIKDKIEFSKYITKIKDKTSELAEESVDVVDDLVDSGKKVFNSFSQKANKKTGSGETSKTDKKENSSGRSYIKIDTD